MKSLASWALVLIKDGKPLNAMTLSVETFDEAKQVRERMLSLVSLAPGVEISEPVPLMPPIL